MVIVKATIHFFAIIGLFLSLGDILGWFKDKDRMAFCRIIKQERKCSPEHPGAQKFLQTFFYPLANEEEKNKPIERIQYVGLFQRGGTINSATSGNIIIVNQMGEKTPDLCSLFELYSWSNEAPFWTWTGWCILASSVVFGIIIFIIETTQKITIRK